MTDEHLKMFHGEPSDVKGVAVVDGETPIAIGGFKDHGEFLEVFSNVTEEAMKYPGDVYRAALVVMEMVDATRKPAFAAQDPARPTAARFLSRLGFERFGEVEGDILWRY